MEEKLSIEHRLQVMEKLLEAAIWGPLLNDRKQRILIALQLYTVLDAAERHQALAAPVRNELYRIADSLAELDNCPDALRPALRSALLPDDSPE